MEYGKQKLHCLNLNSSNSTGLNLTLKRTHVRKEAYIMNKEELLEYIDNNSNAIVNFKDKVRADQQVKNKKRQPAKRWNDARIERQVDKFTDQFISNIYDKLARAIKANNHTPKESGLSLSKKMNY